MSDFNNFVLRRGDVNLLYSKKNVRLEVIQWFGVVGLL